MMDRYRKVLHPICVIEPRNLGGVDRRVTNTIALINSEKMKVIVKMNQLLRYKWKHQSD
jgi:hypothetical protein